MKLTSVLQQLCLRAFEFVKPLRFQVHLDAQTKLQLKLKVLKLIHSGREKLIHSIIHSFTLLKAHLITLELKSDFYI